MLNAVAFLIPVFLLLMLFECYVSYRKQDKRYTTRNTIMNLAIGGIDQICSLFYFAILFIVMDYVYTHFRILTIDNIWYQCVVGYVAVDFLSYWYHRFQHRINILWAGHITHHSSELFNFSNGFRTSFFQGINRIIFWAFLPIFGFEPLTLVLILKVSGIYDFLVHTEYIGRLGFLEKILITPSKHRVHHGKNDIYIDKNYGSTFLLWDKMFGTFQEETEPVKYGIKGNYTDDNPLMAIGYYYRYLWKSMRATPTFSDKFKILLMPPEWKPANAFSENFISVKNSSAVSINLKHYSYFLLCCSVIGVITMLAFKDFLSVWEIIICSSIAICSVTNVAMIFNESIRTNFEIRELGRLSFILVLFLATMFSHPNIYLWPVIGFIIVSILLMLLSLHRSRQVFVANG